MKKVRICQRDMLLFLWMIKEIFMSNEEITNKMLDILKERTKKKCIEFKLKDEKAGLMGNKIGGMPFIPKRGTYPVSTISGEKLHLLIQLNFETIQNIENYPQTGILQIFIEATDCYGLDFDNPQKQSSWRIIYHTDISDPMSEDEILVLMPEISEDNYELPFEKSGKEYKLEGKESEMPITINSFNFDSIYNKYCNDILDDEFKNKSWYSLTEEVSNRLNDELYGEGTRIGGYPGFTQSDPREGILENYMLLLQIDSEGNDKEWFLMWGDSGIANFFIDPDDLKKCDFSKVYYNWDCC